MKIQRVYNSINGVEWLQSFNVSDYIAAVDFMEKRVKSIYGKTQSECVWLVEHTPLYTVGSSGQNTENSKARFPTYNSGRGGKYTYHGFGQRTVYIMLDLKARNLDIRKYIYTLEQWAIDTLALYGVKGERRPGRVGIWVDMGNGREDKICAIGVRIRKWVSFHGIAINVHPNLEYFNDIVPCGISDENLGVTSLEKLGVETNLKHVDMYLMETFKILFPKI